MHLWMYICIYVNLALQIQKEHKDQHKDQPGSNPHQLSFSKLSSLKMVGLSDYLVFFACMVILVPFCRKEEIK